MSVESLLAPWEMPHTLLSSPEEIQTAVASGVLDPISAQHYQDKHDHFVELVLRDADGQVKAQRLSGNLRNNNAGDWQAQAMGGGVVTATATGHTAG